MMTVWYLHQKMFRKDELQSYKEDRIFSVEDRGGAIKIKDDGTYIIDVWMPTHEEVEAFGRKTTTIYLMDE